MFKMAINLLSRNYDGQYSCVTSNRIISNKNVTIIDRSPYSNYAHIPTYKTVRYCSIVINGNEFNIDN